MTQNKGFHPVLQREHPYTFIDLCMQSWPDADFANAHRHGVTAYAVTAFQPHATIEDALEGLMDELNEVVGPLENFVLPGGARGAAHLHVARTICRRGRLVLTSLRRMLGARNTTISRQCTV